MDNLIGKTLLQRYYITEKIGSGGMANVYKARCSVLNRFVAIKILKEEFKLEDEFVNRFKSEARAVALLSHPNIVSIFDIGVHEDLPIIVMELIEGITLKEYITQKGRLSWRETVYFATQILRALEHAHGRKIVHRDIKPQNIMLLQDGTIKVADFGIARFTLSNTQTLTDSAMGSVHYLSPEQAKGSLTDAKSDIYSLGVVMYEMLTGKVPFDADNPVSIAIMHLQADPTPPSRINGTIPPGLESIILKAMRRDASERYQSATEMLRDMDEFRKNPNIRFEYKYTTENQPTQYFKKIDIETRENQILQKNDNEIKRLGQEEMRKPARPQSKKKSYGKTAGRIVFLIACCLLVFFGAQAGVKMVKNLLDTGSFISSEKNDVVLPDFKGKNYDDLLTDKEYENIFIFEKYKEDYSGEFDAGEVIAQEPANGIKVKPGSTVKLTVSLGPKVDVVPTFENTEKRIAKRTLIDLGLEVEEKEEFSDTIISGYVVRTEPESGTAIKKGDKVVLYISSGKEEYTVPSILGLTIDEARKKLTESSLELEISGSMESDYAKGLVASQSMESGTKVPKNTKITVSISEGKLNTIKHYIRFPLVPASFTLSVRLNDVEIYRAQHSASEGSMYLDVKGTKGSSGYVEVFVDEKLHASEIVYF